MLPETIPIANGICLSLHVDMITEITRGLGPSFSKVMLGYAGWMVGQLEDEMRENMWVHLPATTDILFKTETESLWDKSFARIGPNPATLSSTSGTAEQDQAAKQVCQRVCPHHPIDWPDCGHRRTRCCQLGHKRMQTVL